MVSYKKFQFKYTLILLKTRWWEDSKTGLRFVLSLTIQKLWAFGVFKKIILDFDERMTLVAKLDETRKLKKTKIFYLFPCISRGQINIGLNQSEFSVNFIENLIQGCRWSTFTGQHSCWPSDAISQEWNIDTNLTSKNNSKVRTFQVEIVVDN